jgi:hypothetical protein
MNISTLEAFVEQQNNWATIIKQPTLSLLSAEDRQTIAGLIDSQLSPENLSCDGELSRTSVNQRYRRLTKCAEQLLSIDPNVKFYEYC